MRADRGSRRARPMTTRDRLGLPVGRSHAAEPNVSVLVDDKESTPIFVDDSGRRRHRFRLAGRVAVGLCACYLALAAVGIAGHGPFSDIHLPGIGVTTRSVRSNPRVHVAPTGRASDTTGAVRQPAQTGPSGVGPASLRGATTPNAVPAAAPSSQPGATVPPASTPPATSARPTPTTPTTTSTPTPTSPGVGNGPVNSRGNGAVNGHGPTTSPTSVPHGSAKSA